MALFVIQSLRNLFYTSTCSPRHNTTTDPTTGSPSPTLSRGFSKDPPVLALLSLNRETREDALPIFYKQNTFRITDKLNIQKITQRVLEGERTSTIALEFLQSRPATSLRHIKRLELEMEHKMNAGQFGSLCTFIQYQMPTLEHFGLVDVFMYPGNPWRIHQNFGIKFPYRQCRFVRQLVKISDKLKSVTLFFPMLNIWLGSSELLLFLEKSMVAEEHRGRGGWIDLEG
ncbi:hypothetical protein K402DRAFT_172213 [Aulographum hederae CBS 113979]|uniref:Uncharacterized protein n=1 Tax=Aulographum hederae CBS 113979 TaxID=1176131 RepID=A0A6G1HDK6_9PEZI|nr:hypothetical protein K402DRAFT_172213 [Aulographum hederae CBS 113979]